MSASDDIYVQVTDRIVTALEEGTVPWRRPWAAGADSHRNPVSGTVYRGINPFLLELTGIDRGYSDPQWLTFKQAKTRGGSVRKGEKSTLVVFWKMLRGIDRETGEERTLPLLRHYRVFNVEQVDGIDWPTPEEREPFEPIDQCAGIVAGMPNAPTIKHGGNAACYVPAWDLVQLPQPDAFLSAEGYYATTFHELAHATGHASRLNRDELASSHAFGDAVYSREELTAEMASAMLCGVTGISPAVVDNSAAYIKGWLRALKDDRKMLVSAAGRAQRAADYIRGRVEAQS